MNRIKNRWYPAAWSHEVGHSLLARTFFGERTVLFRKASGDPAMLLDRCPHKGAPLSLGELKGDSVQCPYHGLEFDCSGRCVKIPGQDNVPPTAHVRSYPCVERYGLVWFWPGEPSRAHESGIFDFKNHGAPGWECINGPYTLFPASIENILDNLVDPAHTTFVHKKTIGGSDAANVPLTVEQHDNTVVVGRWIENSQPVPVMQKYGNFDGPVDRWQYYHLHLPHVSLVDMGAINAGTSRDDTSRDSSYRTLSYAVLTPETDDTTHYFWFVLRTFALGDAQVSADLIRSYAETFDEDRALLGAIQARSGDLQSGTLRLSIDNASVRVRRALQRLSLEETQPAVQMPEAAHIG